MTSKEHETPTSRLCEAADRIEGELYMLAMGDEPLIDMRCLDLLIPQEEIPQYYVAALTNALEDPADVIDYSNQKVVRNADGYALYISRSPIPYPKGTLDIRYEKITGVQLFSKESLLFFSGLQRSELERAEENDLLRFIEHNIPVKLILSPYKTISVDTVKDLEKVRNIMKEKNENKN